MKILVIEDDNHTAQNISLFLEHDSYILDCASTGADGSEMAINYHYDLILLDLMLPDIHGREILQQIRDKNVLTPILVLSGINQVDERIRTLQSGADDYLTKPFEMMELKARIEAISRRFQNMTPNNEIRISHNFIIKTDENVVMVNKKIVPLTKKEFELLSILASRKNSVFSKEHLVDKLYHHDQEPDSKIIDVFVYKIRKKLDAIAPDTGKYLQTMWGYGYKLSVR